VEISENSENCLPVVLRGRHVSVVERVRRLAGKVEEKTQGEWKAMKVVYREWQPTPPSANFMDLRGMGRAVPVLRENPSAGGCLNMP
jgi:uncharacterized protein (DUF305 family)